MRHFKTYDRNVKDLCRDRLRPSFNTACHADDYKEQVESNLRVFEEKYIAVTNIENIDIAFLIANETKVQIGEWN